MHEDETCQNNSEVNVMKSEIGCKWKLPNIVSVYIIMVGVAVNLTHLNIAVSDKYHRVLPVCLGKYFSHKSFFFFLNFLLTQVNVVRLS